MERMIDPYLTTFYTSTTFFHAASCLTNFTYCNCLRNRLGPASEDAVYCTT